MMKLGAAMLCFASLGMSVSATGVLLPHIERYYHLSDMNVSCMFLIGPIGYIAAAQLNRLAHEKFQLRGVAVIGSLLHIASAAAAALQPPFAMLLVSVALGACGSGFLDGAWCAWAAGMRKPNEISGWLHGAFSAGASLGAVIAGSFVSRGAESWNLWYMFLVRRGPPSLLLTHVTHPDASSEHLFSSSLHSYLRFVLRYLTRQKYLEGLRGIA